MKKISLVAALMVLLCGASLSAKDFDWSQSWCNYGGGIKEGNILVSVDAGLDFSDFVYAGYYGYWFMPPVMVDVQYAKKAGKLPFTFGGFAGLSGYGYNGSSYNYHWWNIFFGAEAAFHPMLPPEKLDVYIVTRIGANIPITNTGYVTFSDYILFGEAIGINWFFSDKVGLNAEVGYPFQKIGVTFKF